MAISYPLSLPTSIGIARIQIRASNVVAISESPFTFRQQVFKHPGERWEATVSLPNQRKEFMEPWVAFLTALKGQTGTFLMGDPNNKLPRGAVGTLSLNLEVNGTFPVGSSSIDIKGLPISRVGVFLAGDYVQFGSGSDASLHKILLDVNSDGSGEATIEIWPSTRRELSDEEPITYLNTVGKFRLSQPFSSWSIDELSSYQISFEAVEAI